MRRRLIWIAPLAILGMAVFITLGGVVVRALWNWLLPPLFHWPLIGFWQALALLVLCRILFGGLGWRGGPGYRMRRRMEERCAGMTPEERDQFRQRMRERWGFGPPAGGPANTGGKV